MPPVHPVRPWFWAAPLLGALPLAHAQPAPEPVLPSPTTLETVQVTATADSAQEERQYSSSAKIVVSREELERLDAATVGELLRQLPGVNLSPPTQGRGGRQRGEDRLQPNVVVDGFSLPGGSRAAFRLPVDLIERIEIIKNSTPEFPSGPGGTINLILRDAPGTKAGTYRAGLSANSGGLGGRAGGTYGDREGEAGVILIGFADTRATLGGRDVSVETFTGGARTGYTLEHDEDSGRSNGLHLISRYTRELGDGARLIVSPMLFGRTSDLTNETQRSAFTNPANATGLVGNGSVASDSDSRNLSGRLTFDYKQRRAGQGETSATLAIQGQTERTDRSRDEYDAGGLLVGATDSRDKTRSLGANFRGKASQAFAKGVHLATFGLDASLKTSTDTRNESQFGAVQNLGAQARAESRESEFALWAQNEWQVSENHTLTPGLRISVSSREVVDALGARIADDTVSWLPSLHYVWRPDERWNLRASVAKSERLPKVTDLSPIVRTTTGQNTLSNPDRGGNPALRPETTTTLQLGVERFLPQQRGSAGLNFYVRDVSDKIQRRIALEAGRYVERPVNFDSASETSVVADFKWNVAELPGLSLRGNLSTSRLRIDASTAVVRQESPRRAASLGVDYEIKPLGLTLGSNLSYSSAFRSEASQDTEQTTRPRTQLDLFAVRKFSRKLSLRFSVDNVTEAKTGDDTLEYSSGALARRETDRARGERFYNLSLEGKF
ncbi:MAG: TonB-dependent receptor [Thiobacillus sp.]|nr:TonB-dependent receptor [Thiobacillus sp.]